MAKIFLTGAFGNIGTHLTRLLVQLGHQITTFDLSNTKTQKKAKEFKGKVNFVWGDLRLPETIPTNLNEFDYVMHLGAIIPPLSEKNPDLCNATNIEGTRNVIHAMKNASSLAHLIFTSSISVFGITQDKTPPRKVGEPLNPTNTYAKSKAMCESMIQNAGVPYTILRLGAANPLEIDGFDPIMFEIGLKTRIEFVHPKDVAVAISNIIDNPTAWGKIFLIGGGPSCQMYYKDYVTRVLDVFGIGALPDHAFSNNPFYTDWLDTTESNQILNYQIHSFESFAQELAKSMAGTRILATTFKFLARAFVLSKSPYLKSK